MNNEIKDTNYGIDAIESLTFSEAVQKRIQMYLGSATTEGIWQGLKEIINNSTDESTAGYGKEIIIAIKEKQQEFSVRDFGRSVPFGFREDGENVLVSIFSKAHTGGKFDHKSYAQSVGTNGIGSSATCLSSVYFQVESYRNGIAAIARFEKGQNVSYKEIKTKEPTGTYIFYKPSKEVFKDAEEPLSYKRVCEEVENISYLNSGVKFIVKDIDNGIEKIYYSENGISDFILNKVKNPLMSRPVMCSKRDSTDEVEVALIWTKDKEQFYCFVNGGYCNEGGAPITGAKTSITNTLKRLIGKSIEPDLFRKGLCYVVNCKVANPSFEGQTKNKINNTNLRSLASQAVKEALESFSNSSEFTTISEMILKIQKAEHAAEKAREAVLNHTKEMNEIRKNKLAFINKLSDAENLGQDAILCIVEGDSAGDSVALGRDTKKYGILRIRGKMKNCLKAEDEEVYKNEEIKMLLYALGIDINSYNPSKLRYGKVAILVDPDSDGYHIALLIMANLHKLCPQFLKENRLCWLRSPLFIESDKNNHPVSWYYTDEDFDKHRGKLKGTIKRIKGLGGLNEHDLKATLFSTTGGQQLDEIEYSPEGIEQLCGLMGVDVAPRKEFVMTKINFADYGDT